MSKHDDEVCFEAIAAAALRGERCPENGTLGVYSDSVTRLAQAGRIKVEISGRNYRAVTILAGPLAGKSTAPHPRGYPAWKTITTEMTVNGKTIPRNHLPSLAPINLRKAAP
jgi:hypothetical protein